MNFNHKSMHSQHKMMFKNYYITSNNQQKEHKFTKTYKKSYLCSLMIIIHE